TDGDGGRCGDDVRRAARAAAGASFAGDGGGGMSGIPLRYRLAWLGVKLAVGIFRLLGRERAARFGGWLARKIGPRLKVHRLAERNMRLALPHLSDTEIAANLDRMWDNLGRNAAEIPFNREILDDTETIELVGGEYLD